MKMLKKALPICLLALVLVISITLIAPKAQAVRTGTCGDNVNWTLDDAGTLTISGTGPMKDYTGSNSPFLYMNCSTVVIESGVTHIGKNAFGSNYNIQSVIIGDDVISIGESAFESCYYLQEVTMGKSIVSVGKRAFTSCYKLQAAIFTNGLTTLGDEAFKQCGKMERVALPATFASMGEDVFYSCSNLKFVFFAGTEEQWNNISWPYGGSAEDYDFEYATVCIGVDGSTDGPFICQSGAVGDTITWTLDSEYTLTVSGEGPIPDYYAINYSPFYNLNATNLVIEPGITAIGTYAFGDLRDLVSVSFPASLASIGDGAFSLCDDLVSISVDPDSAYYCIDQQGALLSKDMTQLVIIPRDLTTYTTPDSLVSIQAYAFSGSKVTSVTLNEGITFIGYRAFEGCHDLTEITLPSTLKALGGYAFSSCIALKHLTLPEGLTDFGESVFAQCSSLESANIPKNITNLHGYTFYNCASLKTVYLPADLLNIDAYAFSYCESLTDVYFGGDEARWALVTIGSRNDPLTNATFHFHQHTFENGWCTGCGLEENAPVILYKGTCGDNVNWTLDENGKLTISGTGPIADYASAYDGPFRYYDCTSVEIRPGVTAIGNYAFAGIYDLTSVIIGEDVTIIGDGAFKDCSNLTDLTIKGEIYSVGDQAFYYCDDLETIHLGQQLLSLGEEAFYSCSSLLQIALPETLTSMGDRAFDSCYNLQFVFYSGTEEQWNNISWPSSPEYYDFEDAKVYIGVNGFVDGPIIYLRGELGDSLTWTLDHYGTLTVSGEGAIPDYDSSYYSPFKDMYITNLVIEPGVTAIGSYVFGNGDNIVSVSIPASVTYIGTGAFEDTRELVNISVDPDSAYYCIDQQGALLSKDMTTLVIIPRDLTAYTTPNSLVTIEPYAFSDSKVTSVTLNEGLTTIGKQAFYCCYQLQSITLPSTFAHIGDHAFSFCTNLRTVTLPEGLTTIGYSAFSQCSSLTEITIPSSVTTIDGYAFSSCSGLTEIIIPNGVTTIGGSAFSDCTGLQNIIIPNSVTSIGSSAFDGCDSLKRFAFPRGLTQIEYFMFWDCVGLTSVSIPDSVTAIQFFAFDGCYNLQDVYYTGSQSQWESIEIDNDNEPLSAATIHYDHTHDYVDGFCFCGAVEPANKASGTCGNDLNWILDENGTLTISGTGDMADYVSETSSPWYRNKDEIYAIVIESGATAIGESAFYGCANLQSLTIGDSVTRIGSYAFWGCSSLTSVTIPDSVTFIGGAAFAKCASLQSVTLGSNIEIIVSNAFEDCADLTDVYFGGTAEKWESITILPGNEALLNATIHYREVQDEILPGDMNGDNIANNDDVVLLLWHTLFPEDYPLPFSADLNKDGFTDNKDVVLLLWHTLFPEEYPL